LRYLLSRSFGIMADPDGITDEELEAELKREIEAELAAKAAQEAALNATNAMNSSIENASTIIGDSGSQFVGGAQLTTFQDNIITTGSDVSILLMVLLLILFIVQMIRKTYQHFTLQSQLQQVANPIDKGTAMAAENLNPMNPEYSHTAFAVYNTEFEEKKLYLLKKGEGAPLSVLKELLLKRAIKCIEKARTIQRDGQGIRKNWNQDLLPREVWHDFQAAQRNLNTEIESVVKENKECRFNWGPKHNDNIFSQAREFHDKKLAVQTRVFQQKMMRKKQINGTKAPPARNGSFAGLQSGFFNSQGDHNQQGNSPNHSRKKPKMTKKERSELRKQKKELKKQEESMDNSAGGQIRRRKPKHRFSHK